MRTNPVISLFALSFGYSCRTITQRNTGILNIPLLRRQSVFICDIFNIFSGFLPQYTFPALPIFQFSGKINFRTMRRQIRKFKIHYIYCFLAPLQYCPSQQH